MGWRVVTPVLVRSLKLSTLVHWIGVQTGVYGFDSRTRKWIDSSEWWWREERWTSRESLWLPAIGTWVYPIRAYKWLGAMSVMFSVCKAPGPHSSISRKFLHSIILKPKKPLGSWNLVNPLLSMNMCGWMNVLLDHNPW